MKRYILPPSLKSSFEEDPVLQQIKEQGEQQKMPEVSFYQAVVLALLEQRNYFMVETFRYAQQYGQLPPLENNGNNNATTETQEEVQEEESYPEGEVSLKLLPKPADEQPAKRFTKTYNEDLQS
jgi:hypothetical protein